MALWVAKKTKSSFATLRSVAHVAKYVKKKKKKRVGLQIELLKWSKNTCYCHPHYLIFQFDIYYFKPLWDGPRQMLHFALIFCSLWGILQVKSGNLAMHLDRRTHRVPLIPANESQIQSQTKLIQINTYAR